MKLSIRLEEARRGRSIPLIALLAWSVGGSSGVARADSAVTFWGNYYLERSTRVISPMATLSVELPRETNIELTYLVDNITSASGGGEPFQEFRQEVRLRVDTELFGFLRPGVIARYSYEPDYTSVTYGGSLSASFFEDTTTFTVSAQLQNDAIHARGNNVEDTLDTRRTDFGVTQILLPQLIVGASFEYQWLNGYTQNAYRNENHPRRRDRFAAGGWLAYRFVPTRTTFRPSYRYYWDDWLLRSHTVDLQLSQTITEDFEVIPQVRFHTQTEVNFIRQSLREGITFETNDPKLFALGTFGLGMRAVLRLSFLEDTALHPFRRVSIHPRYMFFAQRRSILGDPTAFGDAHIAQLGISWPF